MLELYYEVKQQESAKGLLELVNRNLDKNKDNHIAKNNLVSSYNDLINVDMNFKEKK